MCVAIPVKIVEKNGLIGKGEYLNNFINVDLGLVDVKIGDFVLVHAGCALEVIGEDQANELMEIFKLLEDASVE